MVLELHSLRSIVRVTHIDFVLRHDFDGTITEFIFVEDTYTGIADTGIFSNFLWVKILRASYKDPSTNIMRFCTGFLNYIYL